MELASRSPASPRSVSPKELGFGDKDLESDDGEQGDQEPHRPVDDKDLEKEGESDGSEQEDLATHKHPRTSPQRPTNDDTTNTDEETQEGELEPSLPPDPFSPPTQDSKTRNRDRSPREGTLVEEFKNLEEKESTKREAEEQEMNELMEELKGLFTTDLAKASIPPPLVLAERPEIVDVSIRGTPSALHDFVKDPSRYSTFPVKGTTYEYLIREVAHRTSPVAYNVHGRLLPQKALKSLY